MRNSILYRYYSQWRRDIRNWLTPRKIKVKLRGNDGKEFYLHNPPFYLETEIYWQGFENFKWEQQTRRIWSALCSRSGTIFDIGSNTGIFSVLAKVKNPASAVHAFEPQPNIYSVLEKNNAINGFDIICQNMAVSDVNGSLPFYNYGADPFGSENSTAGSLNKEWRVEDQKHIDVEVVTLDSYITQMGIQNIDLLKIDVETLEFQVLEGYREHLHIHKPLIILEVINTEIGNKIHSIFKEKNYSYFNIDESKGIIPVSVLGESKYKNYLICHQEKLDWITNIDATP